MATEIDYIGLLDYIQNNRNLPYKKPENILNQKEKEYYLNIKKRGQAAMSAMKQIVKLCEAESGLDKCEKIVWLNNSGIRTRKYLWAQMKYKEYEKNPISVCVFLEVSEVSQKARFRVVLELRHEKSDQKAWAGYHRHLNVPFNRSEKLTYMLWDDNVNDAILLDCDEKEAVEKLKNDHFNKILIGRLIEMNSDYTNEDYEKFVLGTVKALIPYYEAAIYGN